MSSVTIHPLDDHARIQWPERRNKPVFIFHLFEQDCPRIPNVQDVFFAINDTMQSPWRTQNILKFMSVHQHTTSLCVDGDPKLEPKWPGRCLETVLHRLGRYLQRGEFEPTVYVNNWLLSTNLYEAWPAPFITQLHHALIAYFPQTPIAFRSVDSKANSTLMNHLISLGYQPVFSRFVWYQDPHDRAVYRKKSYLRDGQIFKRSGYTVRSHGSFAREDYSRAAHLYSMLYIEKYSEMNPKFSATLCGHNA